VRRAKLYYLRDRVGKRARVRERGYVGPEEKVEPGLLYPVAEKSDPAGSDGEGTQGATDTSGKTAGGSQPPSKAPA
jgi:large subunit ribosomal protein L19